MTDIPLFILDEKARWRLAYDQNQWILQRRKGAARPSKGSGIRDSGWRGVSFVGSEKCILYRCLREKGVALTPAALAALERFPDTFREWLDEVEVRQRRRGV